MNRRVWYESQKEEEVTGEKERQGIDVGGVSQNRVLQSRSRKKIRDKFEGGFGRVYQCV